MSDQAAPAASATSRATARSASDWLSLAEASRLLGVSGATLRRWADDGRVPVFTTPGGHRRFSRRTLHQLLPASRAQRPSLARLGASPERIVRAYRPAVSDHPAAAPWLEALSEDDRVTFRDRGRQFLELLVEYLDAPDPEVAAEKLAEARVLAAAQGRQVAELGVSLTEAVQTFIQFRAPFTDQLAATARRRGLDAREATGLLKGAESAMDELLMATMLGHSEVAQRKNSRPARRNETGSGRQRRP